MSSLEQHIDRSRHHRQPRRIVVDYTRPGFVRPESISPTCIHGWKEGDCPTCAACAACDGRCGTCPYLRPSREEGER